MEDQSQSSQLTAGQAVSRLNQLEGCIGQCQSSQLEVHFRQYVEIYIRMNPLEEECFMYLQRSLCQHQIIQKLFGAEGRKMGHMVVLELFNLILANTSQTNSLAYIFSQPGLHEYLFEGFDVEGSQGQGQGEAVEYYVQLLKTIILKINNGHNSFIKLFCNNRYFSFPLLCQTCFLATHASEELVRVTARQCVLVLVGLLVRKKVGEGYLVEGQMGVFYHEITMQLSEEGQDQQGSLNYIVDLICALQHSNCSLAMLMNCFTTNVVLARLNNLGNLLRLLEEWSGLLQDHRELPPILALELRLIVYRIVGKLFFSQFVNATYLSAYTQSTRKKIEEQHTLVELRRYFKERFERLLPFLKDFDNPIESSIDNSQIMLSWVEFIKSAQPQTLKKKQQKKTGLMRLFSVKADPIELYIKRALESNGLNLEKNKVPLFKLQETINFPTAFFVVERLVVREQMLKGDSPFQGFEEYQVFYNDNRGNFVLNQGLCDVILDMLGKLRQRKVEMGHEGVDREELGEGEPEYAFLKEFRWYIASHICDYVLDLSKEEPQGMKKLSELLRGLKLGKQLDKGAIKKLLWKLQQLQAQIHEVTFQSDFKGLIRYVLGQNKNELKQNNGIENHQGKSMSQQKIKLNNEEIYKWAYHYQLIASVIVDDILTMTQFVQRQWRIFTQNQENKGKLKMSTHQKNYQVDIVATESLQFQLIIGDEDQGTVKKMNARESGTLRKILEKEVVGDGKQREGEGGENGDSSQLAGEVSKFCAKREEVLTKAIVQYFEQTYNTLCDYLSKSGIRQ